MPDADPSTAYAQHRARLVQAMRMGGALALSFFGTPVRQWTKGTASPVSEADIAVNDLLRQTLCGTDCDAGWLSEESPDQPERLVRERVWVVDPIDGTRAFLAGHEDWSLSAALVESGRPVLAAVYAPVSDQFFFAAKGEGAWLNSVRIRATEGEQIAKTCIAGPQKLIERLNLTQSDITVVPKIGSLALRLARVAEGRIDVALAGGNSHDWDLAAADLLVHEAGGRMTALSGEGLVYNRPQLVHQVLMAAGGARHARLLGHFRQTGWTG